MSEWRPIETAPKDGTWLLLCKARNADGGRIDWFAEPTTGIHVQVAAWWEGEDAWIVFCDMVRDPPLFFAPTHWMPLPEAPTHPSPAPQEET